MVQPHLRVDIRRCLTAAGLPAIVLTALVRIRFSLAAAGDRPLARNPIAGVRVAVTTAIVLAIVWLVVATARAVTSSRRDVQAADRLNDLRVRAARPGYSLWEIQSIDWASTAGQRTVCVNVITGEVQRLWLEQGCLAPGTFILVAIDDGYHHLIEGLDARAVASACRHRRREAAKAHSRAAGLSRAIGRMQRGEANRVIREAEGLLRRQ